MAAKKTAAEGAATEVFETLTTFSPDTLKEGYEKFAKGFSSWADFQKGSIEAFMASAGVVAKGFEKAASTQAGFVKEQFEEGVATAKAAASSKSVQEAFELQNDFVRAAFEKNLGHATKLADHWTGVAKEATDPLTKRYSEFVELVQSYRA
ncbi:MAG: phasin family protein [Pseudomonadota bacterium]